MLPSHWWRAADFFALTFIAVSAIVLANELFTYFASHIFKNKIGVATMSHRITLEIFCYLYYEMKFHDNCLHNFFLVGIIPVLLFSVFRTRDCLCCLKVSFYCSILCYAFFIGRCHKLRVKWATVWSAHWINCSRSIWVHIERKIGWVSVIAYGAAHKSVRLYRPFRE